MPAGFQRRGHGSFNCGFRLSCWVRGLHADGHVFVGGVAQEISTVVDCSGNLDVHNVVWIARICCAGWHYGFMRCDCVGAR